MITIGVFIVFFIFSIYLHIYFCRCALDTSLKSKLFVQISLANLTVFTVLVSYFQWPLFWSCFILYLLLIPAYLVIYVTTQLVSPSKKILMSLNAQTSLTYEQLLKNLEQENLILSRLDELVQSGCVVIKDNQYCLTRSGTMLANFLNIYGFILGRKAGG